MIKNVSQIYETSGIYGIALGNFSNIFCATRDKQLWEVDLNNKAPPKRHMVSQTFLRGLVWDGENTLYICDWNHLIIRYFLDTGKMYQFAGSGNNETCDGYLGSASFCFPVGIVMDKDKNLYVTELRCIRKLDMELQQVITVAGNLVKSGYLDGPVKDALFDGPTGIAVTENELFVTDGGNNCIRKIKDGFVSTIFKKGQFTFPAGILCHCGLLIVADINTVWKIRPDHKKETKRRIYSQKGIGCIATDQQGNIFVGCYGQLLKLETSWKVERLIWIAKLKEEPSYCPMARLPRDIIQELCSFALEY